MGVRIGVVVFPGSNCDRDTVHALGLSARSRRPVARAGDARRRRRGGPARGFAYGDYVRAGVIARFSPVMRAVAAFAADGGLVLGICNGFQVLAEAGLVPGALLRNASLRFAGQRVGHRGRALDTPFTHALDARRPAEAARRTRRGSASTRTRRRSTRWSARARSSSATSTPRARQPEPAIRRNPNGSLHAIAGGPGR